MARHRSEFPQTQNARVRENAERLAITSPLTRNINEINRSDPKGAAAQAYLGLHRGANFAGGFEAARSN